MNIGEVVKKSGLMLKMICYYEFIELFCLVGCSVSGYCYYNENDLYILVFICCLWDFGFFFDEVGKLFIFWQDCQCVSVDVKVLVVQYVCELNCKIEEFSILCDILQDLVEYCQGDYCFDCLIFKDLVFGCCY